jgi:hypothetical protein
MFPLVGSETTKDALLNRKGALKILNELAGRNLKLRALRMDELSQSNPMNCNCGWIIQRNLSNMWE